MNIRVFEIPPSDHGSLRFALTAAALPVEDLERDGRRFFRVEDEAGQELGFGGLEGCGADLLLRSIVVTGARGRGSGSAILTALEGQARLSGASRLHLLTAGTAAFFEARSYRRTDRASAPACIADTEQFAGLCPCDALYLVKSIID